MEKRLILALFLSILVVFIWTTFVAKPPKREEYSEPAPPPTSVVPAEAAREAAQPAAPPTAAAEEEALLPPEEIARIESNEMSVELSDVGATIRRLTLKKTAVVKKESYELVEETAPRFRPFALMGTERLKHDVEKSTGRGVTYTVRSPDGLEIKKRIEFSDKPYIISMELVVKNPGSEPLSFGNMDLVGGTVFGFGKGRYSYLGVDYLVGEDVKRLSERHLKKLEGGLGGAPADALWAAAKNSFFALILIPDERSRSVFYGICPTPGEKPRQNAMIGLGLPGPGVGPSALAAPTLGPGEEVSYSFQMYAGPKDYDLLKAMGMRLDKVMGFFWLWEPLSILILKSLRFFYGICGNYGVAIIFLTIAIRVVLFPLNQKSFKSMKKMQDLAPLLEPLKEKYKKDPKKLQAETMALYKKHGVNPMSGCFPLLLQMPILFAFFSTLRSSVELWGARFLWIKDLSEPDAFYPLPKSFDLPLVGTVAAINLLPLLMLVVFFLQQKMTPTGMGGGAQAAQQQKMMSTIMPIFMGLIFYNMPSGLVLYFTVSTLLGILQQWLVRRGEPSSKIPAKK